MESITGLWMRERQREYMQLEYFRSVKPLLVYNNYNHKMLNVKTCKLQKQLATDLYHNCN